jgi:hypothetical protein
MVVADRAITATCIDIATESTDYLDCGGAELSHASPVSYSHIQHTQRRDYSLNDEPVVEELSHVMNPL